MTAHPNDVRDYSLTRDELQAIFDRNVERLVQERDERQRAADWPQDVERVLLGLVGKVLALEADIAALRVGQA